MTYRGWVDGDNQGGNESYYLYINNWYRLLSPLSYGSKNPAGIFSLNHIGRIDGGWANDVRGVQF